jgi:hypothetical protein
MSTVFCGQDIHKKTTYATVLDSTGLLLAQRRMRDEEIPKFVEPRAR